MATSLNPAEMDTAFEFIFRDIEILRGSLKTRLENSIAGVEPGCQRNFSITPE
jgi:hypothetical protein